MPLKRGKELQPCGTAAAYRRHLKWGEPTDQACRDAWAARNRDRAQSVDTEYQRRRRRATMAAMKELTNRHRDEFQRLYLKHMRA